MTNPAFAHLADTDDDVLGVNGLGTLMDDLLGVEAAIERDLDDDETFAATVDAARKALGDDDWTLSLDPADALLLDRSVDTAITFHDDDLWEAA